jgi:hypothetical protein
MSRQNFLQRTYPIHSIGPKTHVFEHFGPFCYCTKVDAKLAELVPLSRKFAKQSRVGIFRNERTRSTPLDPKLMFWGVLDHCITAGTSMQKWPNWCQYRKSSLNKVASEFFRNEHTRSTRLDPKLMFWDVSDRFVTARKLMQN